MKPGVHAVRYAEKWPFMLLDTIGWQSVDSPEYSNDGTRRSDAGHVIFQYTLRGEGQLEYDGQLHRLTKGSAFLVDIPSPHRYSYPADGEEQPWEFVWLNAKGEDATRYWKQLIATHGPVLTLPEQGPAMTRFWTLYQAMSAGQDQGQVPDIADISTLLYHFVLSLLVPPRAVRSHDDKPPLVEQAKQYMREHYARALSLADIADNCGISRAYLCRLFQRHEGLSPLDYIQQRRIEAAVTLLRGSDLPVQDIGRRCGFDSPSYFGKMFKAYVGLSPRAFRAARHEYPFDHLTLK